MKVSLFWGVSRLAACGLMLLGVAGATSVRVGEHECPICGKVSKTPVLMSYSMFGEPARDLSDWPMFRFAGVEVCPFDGYAAWGSDWEIDDAETVGELRGFLESPEVDLTRSERALIDGRLGQLRDTPVWKILWARSCNALRPPNPRRNWRTAMGLVYHTKRLESDFGRELHRHFRDEAITETKRALEEGWPDADEKPVFRYLIAEFHWRSGRVKEAAEAYRDVLTEAERGDPEPDELEGGKSALPGWAKSRLRRIQLEEMGPEGVNAVEEMIIDTLPNPWREGVDDMDPERWKSHVVALEWLVDEAAAGIEEADEQLWKILERDAGKLVALEETLGEVSAGVLRKRGGKWKEWFDEIAATVGGRGSTSFPDPEPLPKPGGEAESSDREEEPALPEGARVEVNEQRNRNILRGIVLPRRDGMVAGDQEELVARLREWLEGDGASPFESVAWDGSLDALGELIEEGDQRQAGLAGRAALRLMKDRAADERTADYSVRRVFRELAGRRDDLKQELTKDLTGEWRSDFWKNVGAYMAARPGAAERLTKSPVLDREFGSKGRVYDEMLWEWFREARDPVWIGRAVERLSVKEWVRVGPLEYALALEEARLEKAVERRYEWLLEAGDPDAKWDPLVSEAQDIERAWAEDFLSALPVKPADNSSDE